MERSLTDDRSDRAFRREWRAIFNSSSLLGHSRPVPLREMCRGVGLSAVSFVLALLVIRWRLRLDVSIWSRLGLCPVDASERQTGSE
jgi:hypothetical protein